MTDNKNHPTAYIKHQLPGRVRLKIPQKRGDFYYFDHLAELLGDCPGITQLQLNPAAASILICHGAEIDFLAIAEFAETNSLFMITELHLPIAKLASTSFNRLDESLMDFSQGRLDGRSLLILVLIGLAARQLTSGKILGAASSLLWYAFRLLKEENEKMFDLDKYDDPAA